MKSALSRRPHSLPNHHNQTTVRAGQLSDAEVGAAAGDFVCAYYVHELPPKTSTWISHNRIFCYAASILKWFKLEKDRQEALAAALEAAKQRKTSSQAQDETPVEGEGDEQQQQQAPTDSEAATEAAPAANEQTPTEGEAPTPADAAPPAADDQQPPPNGELPAPPTDVQEAEGAPTTEGGEATEAPADGTQEGAPTESAPPAPADLPAVSEVQVITFTLSCARVQQMSVFILWDFACACVCRDLGPVGRNYIPGQRRSSMKNRCVYVRSRGYFNITASLWHQKYPGSSITMNRL
ncbi:unnamed protein product [Schistocephalus solidus]|uniref:PWWP domain-containing protein n=1 Tax=Schistocephalus solidus TaxID=70667 RepID=A0A183TN66_SCHSO|nr:unnamed protein product [Schistocephalus solidus]